jgi:pimeloyl-ACP methyl ester carboxylesterase
MKTLLKITLGLALALTGCSTGNFYYDAPPLAFADVNYGFAVKHTTVNGISVGYIDEGKGDKAIVMVHGLASNAGFWRYNIAELATKYRVIAVDLPGYGKSDKGAYPYTLTFYADVISGLVKELGLAKVYFDGNSMGGQIGIWLCLRHPEQVEKLILTDPAGIEHFTAGEKDWFRGYFSTSIIKKTPEVTIRANLANNLYTFDERFEWMVEERARTVKTPEFDDFAYAVVRSVHAMVDEPTDEILARLKTPTLIIFGERDLLIPNPVLHGGTSRSIGELGVKQIPNARLVMIPDAGHISMMDQPAFYNRTVMEFIGQ